MIQGIGNRFYKCHKHMFLSENATYGTRVVDLEVALWLTRMSELFRFVYIESHVTLHVKSNANELRETLQWSTHKNNH